MKSLYLCVCERGVAYVSVLNSNYTYILYVSPCWCLVFNSMVECDIAVKPNLKNKLNKYTVHTRYTHLDDQLFIQQQQSQKTHSAFYINGFYFFFWLR